MKTVSVRIEGGQAMQLHEIADQIVGVSINGMVQMAIDLWLAVEADVLVSNHKRRYGSGAKTKKSG